jgi:hypothetical protein
MVVAGGDLMPPANLEGPQSFNLLAGMPQFASGQISFVQRQAGIVLVWSHWGEPGFRYLLEKSANGTGWQPYLVVTNTRSTTTFTDSASSGSAVTFCRSGVLH